MPLSVVALYQHILDHTDTGSPGQSGLCNLRLILESYLSQRRQSTSKTRLAPEATKTAPSHPVSQPAHLTYLCSHRAPEMSPITLHSGNIQ